MTTKDVLFPRFDQTAIPDPYPAFNSLREAGPLHHVEVVDGVRAWVVTGFDDVSRVLGDAERLSSDPRNGPTEWLEKFSLIRDENGNFIVAENMLYADPPVHTRLRKLVSKAFTPRRIESLRPRAQQVVDGILDQIGPRGQAELIYEYAFPIPLTIICELFGMPPEDREQFQEWSNAFMVGSPIAPEKVNEVQWQILGYLSELIKAKQREPGDDMLSALTQAHDEGDQLNEVELISMAALLLIAGQETAGNLIGNSLAQLAADPARQDALRGDQALIDGAVEEFLRLASPAMATWRFTTAEVEIAGRVIPPGQAVLALIASANRDSTRFADADANDPHHPRESHLGFGHGIHHCLGAALGRMEAQIALGTLLSRLTDLRLAVPAEELRWRPSLMHGLLELPVTFRER
jgi:cytochrome P450